MKRITAVLLALLLCFSALGVHAEAFPAQSDGVSRNGYRIKSSTPEDDDADEDAGDDIIPCVTPYIVEEGLANVENTDDFWLDETGIKLLTESGFYVNGNGSGYAEFCKVYQENKYEYIPSFITVDSIMHVFHLYFAGLLKNTEKNYLTERLEELCDCMLDVSLQQVEMTEGTDWAGAALRNVAFFDVAFMLISEDAYVEDMVADEVEAELALIEASSQMTESPVFGALEDYSQYKPRGYYEGDEQLERYFRTMMWLGRMNFSASDEDETKSAVLIAHALKELYADMWEDIYDITSFFAGTSDDPGYPEYHSILQEICGEDYQEDDFMNAEALSRIMEKLQELPPPRIASSYSEENGVGFEICFRFMGQRFSLDAAIMQRLVSPRVPGRGLPSVLDFLAALDSDAAEDILEMQGTLDLPGYRENLDEAEEELDALPNEFWESSLYAGWQHVLKPLLEDKEDGYPFFMQSTAWAVKDLECFAGSFAELKHDTILYSKQGMAEGDFSPPVKDDRGYVEPEYEVYERLGRLAEYMSTSLQESGLIDSTETENLKILQELCERLKEISVKELLEEEITEEDYDLIRGYGETIYHLWADVMKTLYDIQDTYVDARAYPAGVIADIATDADSYTVLEVGTGNPNVIYVVVPIDGTLKIARGAVYDYYEFAWDASDRLTDNEWRQMQGWARGEDGWFTQEKAVSRPDWTRPYRGEAPDEDAYPVPGDEASDPEPVPAEQQPEPDPGPEGDANLVPAGPYDYKACKYAGKYVGDDGYEIHFSAYTSVDENEPGLEVGTAEILFDGKSEFVYLNQHYYDPTEWDYDAVYVIRRDDHNEYFGFYELGGSMWLDYFSDEDDFDILEMTEHYES